MLFFLFLGFILLNFVGYLLASLAWVGIGLYLLAGSFLGRWLAALLSAYIAPSSIDVIVSLKQRLFGIYLATLPKLCSVVSGYINCIYPGDIYTLGATSVLNFFFFSWSFFCSVFFIFFVAFTLL